MPQEGSGAYVVPTEQERSSFAAAAKALTSGDLATAEEALAAFPGFEVLSLTDGADGPLYLVIAEKPPLSRGWGFYFFARQPLRPGLVVEAPHPLADRDSELAAARAVSSLRPAAFLLAGAHRYADPAPKSDMAHTSSSIFEAIHEVVSTQAGMVVQVHGFSAAGHQGYPDLLLSSGSAEPGATAEAVCNQVQGGGVGCTLFNGDPTYAALGATTNVQGGYSRRTFGAEHFLHF